MGAITGWFLEEQFIAVKPGLFSKLYDLKYRFYNLLNFKNWSTQIWILQLFYKRDDVHNFIGIILQASAYLS